MKNFLNKLLKPKIEVPVPALYPDFTNIPEWIEQKTAYFEHKYPDDMQLLFNPSSRDYLPRTITSGTSSQYFKDNIDFYREIKKRYPEAVKLAKNNYNTNCYFPGGDQQDY